MPDNPELVQLTPIPPEHVAEPEHEPETCVCASCSEAVELCSTQHVDGSRWCEECVENHASSCEQCGELHDSNDSVGVITSHRSRDVDEVWCGSCADRHSFCCEDCGNRFADRLGTEIGGSLYCERCASEHYECHSCQCEVSADYVFIDEDSDAFCESCYSDRYIRCYECDSETHRRDSHVHNGNDYCSDCYAELEPERAAPPETSDPGVLTKRALGFELEVYNGERDDGGPHPRTARGWSHCHDGSLGNGGREYVSPPIGGANAIASVEEQCRHLANNEASVDASCGFHLHIDATKVSESEIASFTRLCAKMEKWAFSVVPRSRRDNNYCKRLPSDARYTTTYSVEDCAYYHGDKYSKRHKYNSARYCWLNLHSWYFRGTVEIRLHSGTTKAEKILNWAEVWAKIFELAIQTPDTDSLGDCPWEILRRAGVRETTIWFYTERAARFGHLDIDS